MPVLSTGKAEHNAKLRHIISNKKVQRRLLLDSAVLHQVLNFDIGMI
jgi:hypothetical protein